MKQALEQLSENGNGKEADASYCLHQQGNNINHTPRTNVQHAADMQLSLKFRRTGAL